MIEEAIKVGDYVLATKYSDGDIRDQYAVGLVSEILDDRYVVVVDGNGTSLCAGGFRYAKRITKEECDLLLTALPLFELFGSPPTVWRHLTDIRNQLREIQARMKVCFRYSR